MLKPLKNSIREYLMFLSHFNGYSESTIESYDNDLTQMADITGIFLTGQLNKKKLYEYTATLNTRFKPATVIRKLACLKGFLKHSHFQREIKEPLHEFVTFPKKASVLPNPVCNDVLETLLNGFDWHNEKELRDLLIIELLYSSGLRSNELAELTWDRIYFDDRLIKVINTKNNEDRLAPLGQRAIDLLKRYEKQKKGSFVFYSGDSHLTRQTIYMIVKKMFKRFSNDLNVYPHRLRHSFATHMMTGGADIRSIQVMLGHKNINSTMWYTRLDMRFIKTQYDKAHPRA